MALRDYTNDVDELVRECIVGADERFEEIEAEYRGKIDEAGEEIGSIRPGFEEPMEALDELLGQLGESMSDLERAKGEMARKARRVEGEHRELEEALATAEASS